MKDLINNNTPDAPCKDCVPPKRHLGCHSECAEFLSYKEECAEANERVIKQKNFERALFAQKRNVCTRMIKKKK